jgi:hypothetical protein
MKAKVIYWQKLKLQNRFVLEMAIHVDDDKLIEDFKRLALDHMGVKL